MPNERRIMETFSCLRRGVAAMIAQTWHLPISITDCLSRKWKKDGMPFAINRMNGTALGPRNVPLGNGFPGKDALEFSHAVARRHARSKTEFSVPCVPWTALAVHFFARISVRRLRRASFSASIQVGCQRSIIPEYQICPASTSPQRLSLIHI